MSKDCTNVKIVGIDFTSRPKKAKPLTCQICNFDGDILRADRLIEWASFDGFETFLNSEGPWVAGIDFPFGLARRFIENIGWPREWRGYVEHAASSISPQKLNGVPVGLMFFEGTPRLLQAGVTVPGMIDGDPKRIVVEAYPGVLAKRLIGRRSYKQDDPKKQSEEQKAARLELLGKILNNDCYNDYGFAVEAPLDHARDPTGDRLDALFCAMQAAWSWCRRDGKFGSPTLLDPLEGWIADPVTRNKLNEAAEGTAEIAQTVVPNPNQFDPAS